MMDTLGGERNGDDADGGGTVAKMEGLPRLLRTSRRGGGEGRERLRAVLFSESESEKSKNDWMEGRGRVCIAVVQSDTEWR